MTSIETKFCRRKTGYTFFDNKKNYNILEDLKTEPVDKTLRRYKANWLRHVTRMDSKRITKIMLNYRTNGRRRFGRILMRLLDEEEIGLLTINISRAVL